MRNHTLLVLAVLAVIAAPRAHAAEEKGIRLTVLNSMQRIRQDQQPYGLPQAEIQAARNEWESFQVVVFALDENVRVTGAEITDLAGADGAKIAKEHVKLYREEYVRVRRSTRRAELPLGL